MKLGKNINVNYYEIQNPVSHNLENDPSDPKEGQWYYNKTTKRLRYWSSNTGGGAGWIEISPSSINSINLTNEMSGSWSSGSLPATATPALITNRVETSVLNANSMFLFYDASTSFLSKIKWSTISNYIDTKVAPIYSIASDTALGDSRIVLSNGSTTSAVRIAGTTNEIEVTEDTLIADRIVIGLPNSITVSSINVTNLTVNGSPYTVYVHPSYAPNTIVGSGLQFIQAFTSDASGHTTSATLGTIPSATTSVVGVMRFATNAEVAAGTAGVAVQASQIPLAGAVSGTVGYLPVFTSTSAVGNSIMRQNVSTVGVGILPSSSGDKLQVDGVVKTTGVRTVENDANKLLASNATVVKPEGDVVISGGELLLQPLNLIAYGDYTVPSSKNALVYITYDNVGSNTITLPSVAHTGQRIYIMNVNSAAGTSSIVYGATSVEIEIYRTCILYYNGSNWILTGKTTLVNFA